MRMYCITVNEGHYDKIRKLGYIPVGLGNKIKSKKFLNDREGKNIAKKNPYFGEYTFHYWLWKNKINKNSTNSWIGFCQYRKFWALKKKNFNNSNFNLFKKIILKKIPRKLNNYETILGEPIFINNFKFSKFVKKGFLKILQKPSFLINKNNRNIKFHFDLMHGNGNLDKAIRLLDISEKDDFNDFVNREVSFNPHNMIICKSQKILNDYYNSVFPWLKRCEQEFGFDLDGYGLRRIYGFLAERYMSFWFRKHTKYSTLPIIFKDLDDLD